MFEEQIIVDDYLQFFTVFNNKNENIGGKDKNQDRQLLYISDVTNYYSPYNQAFSMQVITFSSINDKLQASGQTTLGFINYASPGSGYAFPTIQNGIVTLNRTLMRDIGVRYAHRQSYGLELFASCYYFGRPIIQGQSPIQIDNKEIFESKVFASRRLFIAGNNENSTTDVKNNGGLFAGINDQITTTSHPETVFYNIMDARPTGYTNYDTWQKFLEARNFDMLAQKDFKGLLTCSKELATKSNGTSIGEAKMFWDSEWNITNIKGEYNVDMSSNFKYKDPETGLIIGSPSVDYSKITQKYMSAILNFNSVVFSPLVQMPYDSNQWLPFALSSIPLIGKLLNALTLGIPVGFIITQNYQQYKKMPFFNGFISAFFASNLSSIIGNDNDNWFIPLNVFSNTGDFAIGKMLGASVSTTAMLMKLSDRISVYPWDPKTGEKLTTKEQISTVDLSQKKDNKVYIMAEDTEFLDIASPFTNEDKNTQWNPTPNGIANGSNYAYIIDTIISQSLHQGEERQTFYSDNPYTYQGDYNEISIAQYRYKNTGSLTNNAFNWLTQYKTNHDEYSETEETTFSYPASILPPSPLNLAKSITIIPDLKIEMIANDVPLIKQNGDNNINEWYTKNNDKNDNFILNLKDYLDPTLLINTFNDLQRFYKSISIYYEYYIETTNFSKSADTGSTKININSESFNPAKTENAIITIDLKDLIFNNGNLPQTPFIWDFYKIPFNNIDNLALVYFGYNDKWNHYKFVTIEFDLKIEYTNTIGSSYFYEQKIKNYHPLNLSIIDNNHLNWNFYLQANLGKIEFMNHTPRQQDKSWAWRFINKINSKVYKIVLNAR